MNRTAVLIALLFLAILSLTIAPFIGSEPIPFHALWRPSSLEGAANVLWQFRIPRVSMAFLAGMGLAASGMVFQAMFRNPLATPFTLGISSGASLGASLCISTAWSFSFLYIPGVTLCAFAGALLTIVIVYLLTTRAPEGSTTATMLLAGVAISFFFSSLILFLQYLSDFSRTFRMLRWVMGGTESIVGFDEVLTVLPFVLSGCLLVGLLIHELNLMLMGEDFAVSRGVSLESTKRILYFAVSLMVGAVVAVCGPIGFVGLMAPHICRLLVGPDHRTLFPATLLLGGAFLVICDTLGRTVLFPIELPVGIITALLGGPFFLWLLFSRKSGFHEFS